MPILSHVPEPSIIISLISLLGSIATVFQNIKAQRATSNATLRVQTLQTQTTLAVQDIQAETARRKSALELALKDSERSETALSKIWEHAQEIKDLLSKLLNPDGYIVDVALEQVEEIALEITHDYAAFGAEFSGQSSRGAEACHRIKNTAWSMVHLLQNIMKRTALPESMILKSNQILLEDESDRLRNIRFLLSSDQSIIAESRLEIREACVKNVIKFL